MRNVPELARMALVAPLLLSPGILACSGSGDGNADVDANVSSDGNQGNQDASNPTPDAGTPDGPTVTAPESVTSCAGAELPTTVAEPPISISGIIRKGSASGLSALGQGESVVLNAHQVATDAVIAGGTFTNADETFTLIDPNSQTEPLDAYLHSTGEGFMDTYVYPPTALTENQDNAPVIMVEDGVYGLLQFLTGVNQDAAKGVLIVAVVDCDQAALAGATVSLSPNVAGVEIRYAGDSGIPGITQHPNTQSRGIAYIFNVPPGEYTVSSSIGGVNLRNNVVKSYAGANTSLITAP